MAQTKSFSPLILLGTAFLLIGTAACLIALTRFKQTTFDIDMSDEDESIYS